jgi:hypothetical protein
MANVRILRVLEYYGEEEVIWNTLAKGGVPANGEYRAPNVIIKSGLIGYPEFHKDINKETSNVQDYD